MSHKSGTKYKDVKRTYKDEFVPLVNQFISREDWNAMPPSAMDPSLQHPIPHVVLSHIEMMGKITFHEAVYQMQKRDMVDFKLSDIQCNFVVAANGAVYEARGWDTQPGKTYYYPGYEGKYIEVTLMGDYTSEKSRITVGRLLEVGQDYKYLTKDFTILSEELRRKDMLPSGSTDTKSISAF